MAQSIFALDLLENKAILPKNPPPVCVVFGDDGFLQRHAIVSLKRAWFEAEDDEVGFHEFDGGEVAWCDVVDELATVSLFAADGFRLVLVERADLFLRQYRAKVEDYLNNPASNSLLTLVLPSWPSNTRLYKKVAAMGLHVDARLPTKSARSKQVDLHRISQWQVAWAKRFHGFALKPQAANRINELVGPNLGLIDQELAKLAVYVDPGQTVTSDLVDEVVGGWRCQTVWEAADAVMDGDAGKGLALLDRLIHAGEHPLALFGQLSWSLRRYGMAAEAFDTAERSDAPASLDACLIKAGFREWNRQEIQSAKQRLKRIGRPRALQIRKLLVETDQALKGSHSQDHRARFALERLCLELAHSTNS